MKFLRVVIAVATTTPTFHNTVDSKRHGLLPRCRPYWTNSYARYIGCARLRQPAADPGSRRPARPGGGLQPRPQTHGNVRGTRRRRSRSCPGRVGAAFSAPIERFGGVSAIGTCRGTHAVNVAARRVARSRPERAAISRGPASRWPLGRLGAVMKAFASGIRWELRREPSSPLLARCVEDAAERAPGGHAPRGGAFLTKGPAPTKATLPRTCDITAPTLVQIHQRRGEGCRP
jgi:hypothetical protein